ncbi:hypothetical protein CASFOL_012484 [Castilleja foliolosa]|uniref:Pentatricopeptide repeat-containing protein n=1 Tax=Castilleja foliolosa TaxID=1961234 RepID=A0ABD3DIJ0_9LAMI
MRFPVAPSCLNLHNLCHEIKNSSSSGRWKDVLSQYIQIKRTPAHHPIDHTIFSHVLKACLSLSFRLGTSVHASLIKNGFGSYTSVGNSVMDFYVKSGALCSTVSVFNNMTTQDSVSWNIIIHGHLDRGDFENGLKYFIQARAVFGFEPNVSTLLLIIQAYRSLRAFTDGQIFHAYLIQSGLWSLTSVQNSLLSMYTDTSMDYAQRLFDEIYDTDVISWSVMIGGYVHSDEFITGLGLFKKMVSELGIEVDGQTMVSVLKGCVNLRDIRIGKLIHGFLVIRGLDYDLFVSNSLIDFYCKCGDIDSAITMFKEMNCKNTVSWNSILSGFVHNEKYEEALNFFASMRQSGFVADEVTLVNLLVIFKLFGDLSQCKSIHGTVIRRYLQSNDLIMNSLIDAYSKCNQIDISWRLFCLIKIPDVVTWSTMISGFSHCGLPDEAISLYRDMPNPNPITILSLLEACALSAEIKKSKWAHGIAIRMGLASEVVLGTAILDMYSKCGSILASRRAFNQIMVKNVVSWSAMIAAYALNGLPRDALALFSEMDNHGLKPNSVTILSVLSSCVHGGLVEEGLSIFKEMANKYGSELKLEHYSCLVDLLARSGNTDDALRLIKSTPIGMKPGASAWGALLSGCRNYEDRKLVSAVFSQVLELEPSSSAGYLLASSVYAGGGSWGDVSGVRGLMRERGVKVVAGYSLVHVDNKAYSFTAGDKFHPLFYLLGPVIEQLHSSMRMDIGARLNVI